MKTTATATRFELVFFGGAKSAENKAIRYRRFHSSLAAAKAEAAKVRSKGLSAANTPIIHGPGCGPDGVAA